MSGAPESSGTAGRPAVALVVAKAPQPGRVKTRLAAHVGGVPAAALAAAALHDTLDACESAFGAGRCYLALDGELAAAVDGSRLAGRLRSWTVLPQRGDGLGERLAHAHADVADAAGAPVVQVGMDTPQLTRERLAEVADRLDGADAVLGPAADGGWWVLGLTRPSLAGVLPDVPMSTSETYAHTHAALVARGAVVDTVAELTDVDDAHDAADVAHAVPETRFAGAWRRWVATAERRTEPTR